MRNKIELTIHRPGQLNQEVIDAVNAYNSGTGRLAMIDIVGLVNVKKCAYPLIYKGLEYMWQTTPDTRLHITENMGKTWTMTLRMVPVEASEKVEELTNMQICEAYGWPKKN